MRGKDYIGTLANMIPVGWHSSFDEADSDEVYVFQRSPRRKWAFRAHAASKREWTVGVSARNEDLAVLRGFLRGAYGPGPFWYVSDVASFTNVLTPEQSDLAGIANTSAQAVGGFAPKAVTGPDSVTLATGVPAVPGKHVTVSIDASGSAVLTVRFKTASGSTAPSPSPVAAKGDLMQRLSWTGIVPATARQVEVSVSGHIVATRPQVTWTPYTVPWLDGGGCASAVVAEAPRSMKNHDRGTHNSLFEVTAKIVEVG